MKLIRGTFKLVGGTIKWAVILGALVIIVVIIVAIVGIGKGVQAGDASYKRVTPKFASIRIGETMTELRTQVGAPQSTQNSTVSGAATTFWYYGTLSSKDVFGYQFVFTNGRLTAKNKG